jgi:hypothetical protein
MNHSKCKTKNNPFLYSNESNESNVTVYMNSPTLQTMQYTSRKSSFILLSKYNTPLEKHLELTRSYDSFVK